MSLPPPVVKRIKVDPSPSPSTPPSPSRSDEDVKESRDPEQDHCTICLQPFLDRTIIPACAHEFCFECIFLWSEQSRKCPLCSRSFDNSYLIHRIRSHYDYQKYYLPPSRSSPPPPLTAHPRANALRNTRRERQWGRRQRQQREEADQLERAIAKRRWIYQHHLYAKHVASNPYTRYRPFPTPVQFSASPDLISRMTTFLRRELRVWPNLDVEFLTTYTISLMKSIDIRSESAVKLLSEFLDLDTPYNAGKRQVNAEHFAHEIYSYLRSPYRDLNTYDQVTQYDAPPEIPPPQEIERGRRWSVECSPARRSRSQSGSRHLHESGATCSPAHRHGGDDSAEVHREDRPGCSHSHNRSPRNISPDGKDHDPRNHSGRRHSPLHGVQNGLRNDHPYPGFVENKDNSFPIQPRFPTDEKGKRHMAANTQQSKVSATQLGGDSAAIVAVGETRVSCLIDGPLEGAGDIYVNKVHDGSSANPQPSRKRSAGLSVHPRNRTLSESVQAYLSRPAVQQPPMKPFQSGDEQPTRGSGTVTTRKSATDTCPSLLLRLSDGPTDPDMVKLQSPWKTPAGKTANEGVLRRNNITCERQLYLRRSQTYVAEHTDAISQHNDGTDEDPTQTDRFLPSANDTAPGTSPSVNLSIGMFGRPLMPRAVPSPTNASDVPLPLGGFSADAGPELVHMPQDTLLSQGCCARMDGAARCIGYQARPARDNTPNLHADSPGRWTPASPDDDAHDCIHGQDHDPNRGQPDVAISTGGVGSSDGTPRAASAPTDTDALELETRLRTRAHLRARVAATKGTGSAVGATVTLPQSRTLSAPHAATPSTHPCLVRPVPAPALAPRPASVPRPDADTRSDLESDPTPSDLDGNGDEDGDGDGDGPVKVCDGGGASEKDKVQGTDKVEPRLEGGKREAALKGILKLRERTTREGG